MPAPAPTPAPVPTDFPPAAAGQGRNGGGFAVARYLAPLAGSYVFNCTRNGSGSGAVSPRLTINTDGTALLDGIAVSPNTRPNWGHLMSQVGRPGTGGQTHTFSFGDQNNGLRRAALSLSATLNADGSNPVVTVSSGADATSTYNNCTTAQTPAALGAFDVRQDLVPRAGSYTANCVKRANFSSGVVANAAQTVRISRAGVIKVGSFKLPYNEITNTQYSESLSGTSTFTNSQLQLSTAGGSDRVAVISFNAYSSEISGFKLTEAAGRASDCTVTGFSPTSDEIEVTDGGELPAGVQSLTAGFSSAFAGDYNLNCTENSVQVARVASIQANGLTRFAGTRITDVTEGTGTANYRSNSTGGGSFTLSYNRVNRVGLPNEAATGFTLNFDGTGQLLSAQYGNAGQQGFACTPGSGNATPTPVTAARVIGASLARSETLNCTRSGSDTTLPQGATAFSIGSDGALTLGSVSVAAASYSSAQIEDGYAYQTRAPGFPPDNFRVNNSAGNLSFGFTATEDTQRNTDAVFVNMGSDSTRCVRQ